MSDEVITLDSFTHVRRVLRGSLIRTGLRYVSIWFAAGVAMAVLGYLMGDNIRLYFLAGLAIGSPALVVAAQWTWHFSLQLKQLSGLEAKVRAGELIPVSEVGRHVYGVRQSA